MAKKRKRRSAIVPVVVLSTAIGAGLCVTPAVVGCNQPAPLLTVANIGFDVANVGFDYSVPPVGFDVAALDFALPDTDGGERPD